MSRRSVTSHLLDPSWSMHQVLGILTLSATSTDLKWSSAGRQSLEKKGDYDRTSSVTSMLTDLKWNTLQERRLQSKTVVFYKIVHQLVAITTAPYSFQPDHPEDITCFLLPKSTVNVHLYSFFPRTMKIWNQLPPEVVSAHSLGMFKQWLPFINSM